MAYYECEDDIKNDLNIVWGAIHKYGFEPSEDNFQIGCIGFLKAHRNFDPSKKYKFSTFAYRCITNEIYMHYRSKSRTLVEKNSVSLEEILSVTGVELNSYDQSLDIESDLRDIVYQAIDRVCKPENKEIFYDVCIKRMNGVTITQTQIAKEYKMSTTQVSRHFRRINQEVKKILAGDIS